jgi:hypothetical protein
MRKLITILLFCICANFVFAQRVKTLSCPEKKWALFHPIAALKVKKIYKTIMPLYDEVKTKKELDAFESGGKTDAFRHIFFMAALSQKISVRKLRKLGKAHEKGNYKQFLKLQNEQGELPDSLGSVMDLQNNEVGFAIGTANRKLNLEELRSKTIEAIKNGEAVYFKRNASGNYVNCSGEIIDRKNYKWSVPKCLIATNK